MFRTHSSRPWFAPLVGSLFMVAFTASASAQAPEPADPNPGNLTLTGSFDVVSTYMFRGIRQNSTGIALWPSADLGIALYSGDGGLKSTGVSPKKTWSGAIGGLVGGVLLASITALLFGVRARTAADPRSRVAFDCSRKPAICSNLAIKRHFDKKDLRCIIPGHGGMYGPRRRLDLRRDRRGTDRLAAWRRRPSYRPGAPYMVRSPALPEGRTRAEKARRTLSIFGATGSIGLSTADVRDPPSRRLRGCCADGQSQVEQLAQTAIQLGARLAVIGDEASSPATLRRLLPEPALPLPRDRWRIVEAATHARRSASWPRSSARPGLRPTLAAVAQGRQVALANKECLVCAGELFMDAVRKAGADAPAGRFRALARSSRRSAGADPQAVERIILTASGGPFRTWTSRSNARVPRRSRRCSIPNWSMGAEDHHRFGHPDEQGAGADRGLSPVRLSSRAARRASCIRSRSSMPSSASATARCSRSWRSRHAHPDRPLPRLARAHAATARRGSIWRVGTLTFETPGRALPGSALARQALQREDGAAAHSQRRQRDRRRGFSERGIGFLDIAALVEATLERRPRGCAMSARLDDVMALDVDRGDWRANLLELPAARREAPALRRGTVRNGVYGIS